MIRINNFLLGVFLLFPTVAFACEVQTVADIGSFQFENGKHINSMHVGYGLYGHLNAKHDNAILLLPPTSGTKRTYDALIGPNSTFDTNRFFIIVVDPIGGGCSSKPSDGLGGDFPHYTIRDMVAAQEKFLRIILKIDHLHSVVGASMGAFQAIEWGVRYPSKMDKLALVAPAARSDIHLQSIVYGMDAILSLGKSTEKKSVYMAVAALFQPWLRSDEWLKNQGIEKAHAEVTSLAQNWTLHWSLKDFSFRYQASAEHNVSIPYGGNMETALKRVKAHTLVVSINSDRTVPFYLTEELLKNIKNVQDVRIKNIGGHSNFLDQQKYGDEGEIWQEVKFFLRK